jgi:uncharacterized membrane protein
MTSDPRNPVPDLMKGIAVVAMIQVHLMELFARQEIYDSMLGKISLFLGGPFAAPVFMAVMGYFIAASRKGRGDKVKRGLGDKVKRGLGDKVRRGFLLILLGLLLNIGLNFHLLIKIYNGTFDLNPLEYIFGADILSLAGLSMLFIVLMETLSRKPLLHSLMIALLISILHPLLPDLPLKMQYIQAFFYGDYSWSYFPLLPWLAYPMLGYGFYKFQTTMPAELERLNRNRTILLILSAIILMLLFLPAFKIITDLPAYYHHQVFLFAWIAVFLVFFTWLAKRLDSVIGESQVMKYIKWLGKNVTVVYVVQWLIIGNIATVVYKTQSILALITWFAAILAAASLISFAFIRFKRKLNN